MKALFKKSLIIALMILISANAIAASCSPTGVFQWTGAAPKTAINKGRCILVTANSKGIVPQGSTPILLRNPSKDGLKHDIHLSTELAFTVVEQTDNVSAENKIAFTYEVINFKVGIDGGPLEDQDLNRGSNDARVWMLKFAKKNDQPAVLAPLNVFNANTDNVVTLTVASDQFEIAARESLVVQVFMLIHSTLV